MTLSHPITKELFPIASQTNLQMFNIVYSGDLSHLFLHTAHKTSHQPGSPYMFAQIICMEIAPPCWHGHSTEGMLAGSQADCKLMGLLMVKTRE